LRYDGILDNGAPTEQVVWAGVPHASTSGPISLAPRDWLKTLKDGSELKVTFRVNFDKVLDTATAVTFPLRTYTIRAVALITPTLTTVSDSRGPVPEGGITV
ncbi:hypothetical protein, partial [Pseudomonas sp. F01002]|uniref:hypothetical protein n=1 Tax=Pseudomonas sp. F01002 TaxID=2555724 RepID=UPI00141B9FDB